MINLSLEQLQTFLVVKRLGSISKAATALSVTQPAVTSRLKTLEHNLGTDLFAKDASKFSLTAVGEKLLFHAERMEALVNTIEKDIAEPRAIKGTIRIGASETIAQTWLPHFISSLHDLLPEILIEYHVDVSSNLRNSIINRETDLAFLLGPIDDARTENLKLPEFELDWYTAVSEEITDKSAAFLNKPILTYAKGTKPFYEIQEALKKSIIVNTQVFPSSSLYGTLRMVEQGLGVAALPKLLGDAWVTSGKLQKFQYTWIPSPLIFTASFMRDAVSPTTEKAAQIASQVAYDFHRHKII